ncbi:MAG: hypothetical protein PWR30_122 [Candidatus Woesearchaeota archaeon]|nr:hypothetical protein [Candidatus Woesearchaeota archaeon]
MLKIINDLWPFFEDNYRRIHVREYARIQKISPPTSSKILEELYKEKLLKKEIDRGYFFYYANRDSYLFIDLQRIYWRMKLREVGLIDYILKERLNPVIILFGSIAKAEAKKDSDIDLAVFSVSNRQINPEKFQKRLKKEIHILSFKSLDEVPDNLKQNILNSYIIEGQW